MNKNAGWPAFPSLSNDSGIQYLGISARDLFALATLHASIVAGVEYKNGEAAASAAYGMADLMIVERNK